MAGLRLKEALREAPIRRKLLTITLATTALALLLAGGTIVTFDYLLFRESVARDLNVLSTITADNSTAALAFNDPGAAEETLAALKAKTHLMIACIVRPDGSVLAEYARPDIGRGCPKAAWGTGVRFEGGAITSRRDVMLGTRTLGMLVIRYDLGELAERVRLFGGIVIAVLVAATLFSILLSARLRALIADPVSMLMDATTTVAATGDYATRAVRLSGDELGILVDRFNEMLAGIKSRDDTLTRALADREAALREAGRARERFRFMAESMPEKIFTANAAGVTDYLNQQWTEFTGVPVEQLKQNWYGIIHPDELEESIAVWRHALENGEGFRMEARLRRADGEYRWHLTRALPMRDGDGKISMWIGSITEIQEQKEKEAELRRANEDLQQFAYSASHDLQEPIRNVSVYSEIISRRYSSVLDSEGQQFLGFLAEGGRRLVTLINDLLAYTRAGMIDQKPSAVDANTAVEHALANLSEAIRESGAVVTCDVLPQTYMSEAHLQQLFQNLVGNALKYRQEAAPPRVHISAVRDGAVWRFSVTDNGIGIDPQYKETIFGVFKRLHRDQKYSGTGIGLAICQRVVESYGGRIWVESVPGRGATFFFTAPANAPRTRTAAAESSAG